MLRSYFISAFRNLLRNKVQSLIQVFSLAIGMAVFSLVAFYIFDELTVDRSNPYFHQVYRTELPDNHWLPWDVVNVPLGGLLEESIPEIVAMTRVYNQPKVPVSCIRMEGEIASIVDGFLFYVDSGFQQVFPQDYLLGDPGSAFTQEGNVVLSESVSRQLFGEENPMGKPVYLWNSKNISLTVTGVVKDPRNEHLKFGMLLPIDRWLKIQMGHFQIESIDGYLFPLATYVRLQEGTDISTVEKKIAEIWGPYGDYYWDHAKGMYDRVHLRSLKNIHFSEQKAWRDYMRLAERKDLLGFLWLGLGILFLGIINYVNLATARAGTRGREIAIRQICGSGRRKLVVYFLVESILTASISFFVAVTLVQLSFRSFNALILAEMELDFLKHPLAWVTGFLFVLLIGLLAGIHPALSMSSGSHMKVFHGGRSGRGKGLILRRVLLLIQFSFTVILLVSIFSIQRQINQMKIQDPGFEEQVFFGPSGGMNIEQKQQLWENIRRIPEIRHAAYAWFVLGGKMGFAEERVFNQSNSVFDGMRLMVAYADPEFFSVYGLKLTHGEDLLNQERFRDYNYEGSGFPLVIHYVINETCLRALDIEDPIGYEVAPNCYIAGVVEDFHYQSLKYPVQPLLIMLTQVGSGYYLNIRIDSPEPYLVIRQVEELKSNILKEAGRVTNPVLDRSDGLDRAVTGWQQATELFKDQYEEEERMRDASVYLSLLAIALACLGLFGLSTFMVQRRTQEIGIRKAMGSSEYQVFILLVRDFLTWVAIAIAIGLPVGGLLMRFWKQQFAFQAGFPWWIYLVPMLIVIALSVTTVAWQSFKISRTNPTDSLRTE